jgi:hypothetical protein
MRADHFPARSAPVYGCGKHTKATAGADVTATPGQRHRYHPEMRGQSRPGEDAGPEPPWRAQLRNRARPGRHRRSGHIRYETRSPQSSRPVATAQSHIMPRRPTRRRSHPVQGDGSPNLGLADVMHLTCTDAVFGTHRVRRSCSAGSARSPAQRPRVSPGTHGSGARGRRPGWPRRPACAGSGHRH